MKPILYFLWLKVTSSIVYSVFAALIAFGIISLFGSETFNSLTTSSRWIYFVVCVFGFMLYNSLDNNNAEDWEIAKEKYSK